MESNDFVKAVLEEGLGALRLLAPQVIDADYEALTFVLHHLPVKKQIKISFKIKD